MTQDFNAFDNQRFRDEFNKTLDEKLSPITELLKAHQEKLEEHEAKFQRQRGGMVVLGGLWAVIVAIIDWVVHIHSPRP